MENKESEEQSSSKDNGNHMDCEDSEIPSRGDSDGLNELGVVGYDQNEFEAGILRELDDRADMMAKEQQRKFAAKELRDIGHEINQTRNELSRISRLMTTLLHRPINTIITELNKQRTLQAEKKTHLAQLVHREKCLRECIKKDDFQSLNTSSAGSILSNVSSSHDQESHDLIKTGLLTPFGTTSTDKGVGSVQSNYKGAELNNSDTTHPPKGLTEFDWLGIEEQPTDSLKGKGKGSKHPKTSNKFVKKGPPRPQTNEIEDEPTVTGNEATVTGNETTVGNEATGTGNEATGTGNEDEHLNNTRERRKQRPRPPDNDSDEDELIQLNWESSSTKKSKQDGRDRDDGDIRLYKERLRQYKLDMINDGEELVPVEFDGGFKIPASIWHKLYRYQQTGVKWLWELHCQQAGGILGDEMGLGKTIQMVAFLAGLKISNLRSHVTRGVGLGPVLIVCPATVLYQWVAEFHKWTPVFRVAVFHDTGSFKGTKAEFLKALSKSNGIVITTYANVRLYSNLLLGCQWDYMILDEGHKIRNPDAEITLTCKQFGTPHRIILSGSPMQNNLRELWSLFDFVFPGKLGTLPVFMEQFSVPITIGGYTNASQMQVETAYQCACILRDTINPYLLRRLKSDVKIQLPNKNEQVLFCHLTDYQRELYEDYIKGPEVEDMMAGRRWIFSGLMKLRKLCNHPDLVTSDYQNNKGAELDDDLDDDNKGAGSILNDKLIDTSRIRKKKRGTSHDTNEDVFGHYSRSGKMIVVETLLKIWYKQKHKVLLFTQSKLMLKIFEKFIINSGYSFLKMDGTTAISSRQNLIKRFNEDSSVFIFLLTTRVGGLGVNLTGADRIILYDPDWNPSTDTQAKERAWRIGQTRPVTIYRLLTAGTIEEKIYHRQIFKQFLTNRVLRDPKQRRFFKSNDLYELFTLGSSDGPHKTETGVIFAGTGSEVKVQPDSYSKDRKKKRKNKSSDTEDEMKTTRKKRKTSKTKERETSRTTRCTPTNGDSVDQQMISSDTSINADHGTNTQTSTFDSTSIIVPTTNATSIDLLPTNGDQQMSDDTSINTDHGTLASTLDRTSNNTSLNQHTPINNDSIDNTDLPLENSTAAIVEERSNEDGENEDSLSMEELVLLLERRRRKKKKKQKKRRRKLRESTSTELEGHRVKGLERMDAYEPGSEDEEDKTMDNQNNMILKKLFSKTGVATAIHHDTIMNSGNPDFAIVESEANRIAKSAARALKDSRQRCLGVGGANTWGQPTWTGIHGTKGAPKRRFGISSKLLEDSSNGSHLKRSDTSTVSSVLLTKMKKRNSQRLPASSDGASGIHSSFDNDLVKRIRDFIALECKKNGQATTKELLDTFTSTLRPTESPLFRSMLHEICDFHRYHGDGIWTLKAEYR